MRVEAAPRSIEAKVAKCRELEAKYLPMIQGSDRELSIRAAVRSGELYLDLAEKIRGMPLPATLTPEQQELVRAELDARAFGPEEKAIEAFNQVQKMGAAAGISNKWTKRAERHLRRLTPDKFPPPPARPPLPASDGSAKLDRRGR